MNREQLEEVLRKHLAKALDAGKSTESDRLSAILDAMDEVWDAGFDEGHRAGQHSMEED